MLLPPIPAHREPVPRTNGITDYSRFAPSADAPSAHRKMLAATKRSATVQAGSMGGLRRHKAAQRFGSYQSIPPAPVPLSYAADDLQALVLPAIYRKTTRLDPETSRALSWPRKIGQVAKVESLA